MERRSTGRRTPSTDPERVLARQPWAGLRALVPGGPEQVEQTLARLQAFARLLLQWNRGVSNLVSRHDEPRLVERHFAESLAPAQRMIGSGCRRYVDFGSGGGFPAVPLVLAGVGERWTLVESRRNKALFLMKVKQQLELNNIEIVTGRLEMLVESDPGPLRCDGFTSRATMRLEPTLAIAARIVEPGGTAFLWKGSGHQDEIASSRTAWQSAWRLEHIEPMPDGPMVVAIFQKL